MNADSATSIATRIADVMRRVEGHASDAQRKVPTVIAASKSQSEQDIRAAYQNGMRHFGENYGQELRDKRRSLSDLDIQWHFFGRLQKNKLKYVMGADCVLHSIDSLDLLKALYRRMSHIDVKSGAINKQQILLQINISGEMSKAGFAEEDIDIAVQQIQNYKETISCLGFMTMLPFESNSGDQMTWFSKLYYLADKHAAAFSAAPPMLSMGMSGDYQSAIASGASHLRLGRAIFGEREGNAPAIKKTRSGRLSLLLLASLLALYTRNASAISQDKAKPFTVIHHAKRVCQSHSINALLLRRSSFPWITPMYSTPGSVPLAKRHLQHQDLWEHVIHRFSDSQYGPFDTYIVSAAVHWHLDPFILKGLLDNESHLKPVAEGKRIYMIDDGKVSIISGGAVGIAQFTTIGIQEVNSIRNRSRSMLLPKEGAHVELNKEHLAPFSRDKARIPRLAIYAAAQLLAAHIQRFGRDGGITAYNSGNTAARAVQAYGFYAAKSMLALRRHNNTLLQGSHFLTNVLQKANVFRKQAGLHPLVPT